MNGNDNTPVETIVEKPEEGEVGDDYVEADIQRQAEEMKKDYKRPYPPTEPEAFSYQLFSHQPQQPPPPKVQEHAKYKIEKNVGKGSYG